MVLHDLKCGRNCNKIISNWVEMSLRMKTSTRTDSYNQEDLPYVE